MFEERHAIGAFPREAELVGDDEQGAIVTARRGRA